jgi:PHP family Zn ribbon phosphoesterase
MTLKQLISRQGWLNIEAALRNEYPNEQNNLADYEAVYHKLLLLSETETDLQIVLKQIRQTDITGEGRSYVDVVGKKQTPHIADADLAIGYALNFTPWAEWLAMPVTSRTLQSFPESEIIAHCLWEMTFHSFDEDVISDEKVRLSLIVSEIDSVADEEYWQNLISWDPITTQLNKEE